MHTARRCDRTSKRWSGRCICICSNSWRAARLSGTCTQRPAKTVPNAIVNDDGVVSPRLAIDERRIPHGTDCVQTGTKPAINRVESSDRLFLELIGIERLNCMKDNATTISARAVLAWTNKSAICNKQRPGRARSAEVIAYWIAPMRLPGVAQPVGVKRVQPAVWPIIAECAEEPPTIGRSPQCRVDDGTPR